MIIGIWNSKIETELASIKFIFQIEELNGLQAPRLV